MTGLPLLVSVPHAGLEVPDYLLPYCQLSSIEIAVDGDEGAREIYDLSSRVAAFVTTEVARAIVDLNRAEDDRRKDGVVKTHTCWDVPVYRKPVPETLFERLLAEHYRPYHARLTELAGTVRLGVDCHTMVAIGPPVAPDPGCERPLVCLGDGDGSCPRSWAELMRTCFARYFPGELTINRPFRGGHITRFHGREMPWIQFELSRTTDFSKTEKAAWVLAALTDWCAAAPWSRGPRRMPPAEPEAPPAWSRSQSRPDTSGGYQRPRLRG